MIKFRLYFDKDKETIWLNKMSEAGLSMTGFFAGFYRFEKCEPGKYVYQIDFGEKLFAVQRLSRIYGRNRCGDCTDMGILDYFA